MTVDATSGLLAALLMGLAGAGHCLAMCGGIAGALGPNRSVWQLGLYNLGRITSYTIAGALVGLLSQQLLQHQLADLVYLRLIAAAFLVALGLYYGGWWLGLRHLERIGKPLWQVLQPVAAKIRQRRATPWVFATGLVWGWLPCGLVYSALSWAAISGNSWHGATYMLMFGIGTLPAMFAFGWFSTQLQSILQSQGFRKTMGIAMIAYALWIAIFALQQGHMGHTDHSMH